ncbi:MAG: hypothetical protein WCN98_14900 [Verrucomicrobiaceae bacterium]
MKGMILMMMPRLGFQMLIVVRAGLGLGRIPVKQNQISMSIMLKSRDIMIALHQSRQCTRRHSRCADQT